MNGKDTLRIFISHTVKDKEFAHDLASEFRRLRYRVWFDDWEIAVGDSIVEKVFDGLRASDTLIVVLSPNSVESRWVKEELNVAVMRRISERDIRILPVLIETCDVPTPLKHIRYADFRENHVEGMSQIMEAISPGHLFWKSLAHLHDHFCLVADQVAQRELDEAAAGDLLKIHDLLEAALDLRTEIELRRARQNIRDLNFFEKIGFLVNAGLDVRSQTWNALVYFRSGLAHDMNSNRAAVETLAIMLRERYATGDCREVSEVVVRSLSRLKNIMRQICFERWDL